MNDCSHSRGLKYADRLRILASSWATANNKVPGDDKNKEQRNIHIKKTSNP